MHLPSQGLQPPPAAEPRQPGSGGDAGGAIGGEDYGRWCGEGKSKEGAGGIGRENRNKAKEERKSQQKGSTLEEREGKKNPCQV